MNKAVQDVLDERAAQEARFDNFDKTNTQNDWVAYIASYSGRASAKVIRNQTEGQTFRANMVKTAALALAAVEAHDKGYC